MRFRNISVGRYQNPVPDIPRPAEGQGPTCEGAYVEDLYGGWIEGEREDGTSWIMFLTDDGNPVLFWGERDEGGGVIGEPVHLVSL